MPLSCTRSVCQLARPECQPGFGRRRAPTPQSLANTACADLAPALHRLSSTPGGPSMREKISRMIAVVGIAGAMAASPALAGDVRIGVNIGTPPPPVVVAPAPPVVVAPAPAVVVTPPSITFGGPPPLVVVPGAPTVQYVPTGAFNVFVFGGRYYSFHNGYWFHAGHYNGPWAHIKTERVPAPVIGVPVTYYRVPPPGHVAGPAGHCPPGQAKKGRC